MSDSSSVSPAPFTVYGYARASTDLQVMSTAQQESVIREAFHLFQRTRPAWANATFGGMFKDEATSRVGIFREREGGSRAITALQPGDLLLISNYDRIFANVQCVCDTLVMFSERQIKFLILDCDIDTSTIHGEFFIKLMALVKELDVKETRRRTREALQHRKRQGLPFTRAPLGWKCVKAQFPGESRPRSIFQKDEVYRALGQQLWEIKDRFKLSKRGLLRHLNEHGPAALNTHGGKGWHFEQMNHMLKATELGFPLVNGAHEPPPLPPGVRILTAQAA